MPRAEFYKIFLVTLANWTVAIGITLLNKWLLSHEKTLENFPVTIIWLQSLTAVAISTGIILCQRFLLRDPKVAKMSQILNSVRFKETVILSLISVVSLLFTTIVLKYFSVALFTISRTLSIIFTVLFTRCFLKESSPMPVLIACTLIAAGYLTSISSDQLTSALRIKNIAYSTIAGMGTALGIVYVKLALPDKKSSVLVAVLINNVTYRIFLQ